MAQVHNTGLFGHQLGTSLAEKYMILRPRAQRNVAVNVVNEIANFDDFVVLRPRFIPPRKNEETHKKNPSVWQKKQAEKAQVRSPRIHQMDVILARPTDDPDELKTGRNKYKPMFHMMRCILRHWIVYPTTGEVNKVNLRAIMETYNHQVMNIMKEEQPRQIIGRKARMTFILDAVAHTFGLLDAGYHMLFVKRLDMNMVELRWTYLWRKAVILHLHELGIDYPLDEALEFDFERYSMTKKPVKNVYVGRNKYFQIPDEVKEYAEVLTQEFTENPGRRTAYYVWVPGPITQNHVTFLTDRNGNPYHFDKSCPEEHKIDNLPCYAFVESDFLELQQHLLECQQEGKPIDERFKEMLGNMIGSDGEGNCAQVIQAWHYNRDVTVRENPDPQRNKAIISKIRKEPTEEEIAEANIRVALIDTAVRKVMLAVNDKIKRDRDVALRQDETIQVEDLPDDPSSDDDLAEKYWMQFL